jgi:hypothetical protein
LREPSTKNESFLKREPISQSESRSPRDPYHENESPSIERTKEIKRVSFDESAI